MAFKIDTPGGLDLSSLPITNLADPTAAQDAATKNYVDMASNGLDVKGSCRAATTADITLSGTQTIDGVSVIADDRVLVKDQTSGEENGIYVVAAGAWSRSTDADEDSEVTAGLFTWVAEGTTNGDTQWVLTTDDPITVDTTSLTFDQFSGAAGVDAGDGLDKTGNTLSVNVDDSTIEINADTLRVKDGGITSAKMASNSVDLGTSTVTGTLPVGRGGTGKTSFTTNGVPYGNGSGAQGVTAAGAADSVLRVPGGGGAPAFGAVDLAAAAAVTGILPVEHGGTGGATGPDARSNIGATGRYTTTNASGTDTTVNHALGTRNVIVEVYETNTPYAKVLTDVEHTDNNNVTVKFGNSQSAGDYTIVVVG